MSELSELLERVRKATGPDRKIDAAIARLFDLPICIEPDCLPDVMRRILARMDEGGDDPEVNAYTASIDAALALVERVLPGWSWSVGVNENHQFPQVVMARSHPTNKVVTVEGATPALAILAALMAALANAEPQG
jgi:hypothetical protein